MRLLSFGEVLFDVYGEDACIGGAPLNFAAHAHRAGAESFLLSALGRDALGTLALEKIRAYGVRTDAVAVLDESPTGVCNVTLDEKGVPRYELLTGVAYDSIPVWLPKGEFDGLYFGTLALRSEANRESLKRVLEKGAFREVFVDLNVRLPFCDRESLVFALSNATVLKVSDEELPYVMQTVFGEAAEGEDALQRIAARFSQIKMLILTCGARGAMAYDRRDFLWCDAVKTEVVSTVGAGDSFSASFFVSYLQGENVNVCLQNAAKLSAYVVSKRDAIPD